MQGICAWVQTKLEGELLGSNTRTALLQCSFSEVATRIAAQVARAESARMRDLADVTRVISGVAAVVVADALFHAKLVVPSFSS